MSDDDILVVLNKWEIDPAIMGVLEKCAALKAENARLSEVAAAEMEQLEADNARLREALRYVRRTVNPTGPWVTIGVDNAIACIDAALSPLAP